MSTLDIKDWAAPPNLEEAFKEREPLTPPIQETPLNLFDTPSDEPQEQQGDGTGGLDPKLLLGLLGGDNPMMSTMLSMLGGEKPDMMTLLPLLMQLNKKPEKKDVENNASLDDYEVR